MIQKINHLLMKGTVDKDLYVTYRYKFSNEEYPTIKQFNGLISIAPTYSITISRNFEDSIFIPDRQYFSFVELLSKTTRAISDELYKLFPDINDIEFGIDHKMLDIFRVEKAMSTNGITMLPTVWVDSTSKCYPGIEISGNNRCFKFPLEDAIIMNRLFDVFDPINMGMNMLRMLGKIE